MTAGPDELRADGLTPTELLLGHGAPAEQDAVRQRIAADPALALEVAETVALFEQLRQLRVEPSARYATKLADVDRRARLRASLRARPVPFAVAWRGAAALLLAALLVFAVLAALDPFGLRRAAGREAPGLAVDVPAPRAPAATPAGEPPGRALQTYEMDQVAQTILRRVELEAAPRLAEALESGLRPPTDALSSWLEPRNAINLLRLDHELRASAQLRERALLGAGALAVVDARVQVLADRIAEELPHLLASEGGAGAGALEPAAVAAAVRALLGAGGNGPGRAAATALASNWLATRSPQWRGAALATSLGALCETAAVHGWHAELVRSEGERLLDDVLRGDDDTWRRHRPELLMPRVASAVLGECGRTLALLPGFGVDPQRCALVRLLLLGQLRERLDHNADGPETMVAITFGFGDLLSPGERGEFERRLRKWKPVHLAPDFVTLQQLAWATERGRVGFTRLQWEMRRLACIDEPVELAQRAALCLCLAASYAAPGAITRQRLAAGS